MPRPATRRELVIAIIDDGRYRYEIAHDAGLSPTLLSGVVTGRVNPTPEQRAAIAAELGRPVGELFPAEVSA